MGEVRRLLKFPAFLKNYLSGRVNGPKKFIYFLEDGNISIVRNNPLNIEILNDNNNNLTNAINACIINHANENFSIDQNIPQLFQDYYLIQNNLRSRKRLNLLETILMNLKNEKTIEKLKKSRKNYEIQQENTKNLKRSLDEEDEDYVPAQKRIRLFLQTANFNFNFSRERIEIQGHFVNNPNLLPSTAYDSDVFEKFSNIINNLQSVQALGEANFGNNFVIREVHSKQQDLELNDFYNEIYSHDFGEVPNGGTVRKRTLFLYNNLGVAYNNEFVLVAIAYITEYDSRSYQTLANTKKVYLDMFDTIEFFNPIYPGMLKSQIKQAFLSGIIGNSASRGFETFQFWACPPYRSNQKYIYNRLQTIVEDGARNLRRFYQRTIEMATQAGFIQDYTKGGNMLHSNWFYGKEIESYKYFPYIDSDIKLDYCTDMRNKEYRRLLKIFQPTANPQPLALKKQAFINSSVKIKTKALSERLLKIPIGQYENSIINNLYIIILKPPTTLLHRTRGNAIHFEETMQEQVRILDNIEDNDSLSPFQSKGALLSFQQKNYLTWLNENDSIASSSFLLRLMLLAHENYGP